MYCHRMKGAMYLIERLKAPLTVPKITVDPCGSQPGLRHGIHVFQHSPSNLSKA